MGAPVFKFVEWENKGLILRGALHCVNESGGPWCIFVHGFTGHHIGPNYLFVRMSRELATAGFSSLRFDFSGCGESEGLFRNMTVDTMNADLLSAVHMIRERFSPSKLILIGHSLGGMVTALCTAEAKPDGIVLMAPVAEPEGLMRRRKQMIEAGPNAGGFYENGPHELNPRFLDGLKGIDPAVSLAGAFHGSLLLVQGNTDASIPVEEACRYTTASRAAGIETTERILAGADHSYSTVRHSSELCSLVTAWAKERFA